MSNNTARFLRYLIFLFLFLLVAFGSFLTGRYLSTGQKRDSSLPVIGTVPAYHLTNQLGQSVSSDEFKGKIRVVSFLFPYCREYCPLIAINLVNLENLLKSAHIDDRVQLIAYNVDPGQTGPAQMKEFMSQYGWNPENTHWQYLTGPPEEIKKIVRKAYYISYQRVSESLEDSVAAQEKKEGTFVPSPQVQNRLADRMKPDYDVTHNDAIAIVDAKGRIRKIFDDADHVSNRELLDVINSLLPNK